MQEMQQNVLLCHKSLRYRRHVGIGLSVQAHSPDPNVCQAADKTTVLELVAEGARQKYPTPEAWPPAKPWYALRDGIQTLREEAMKSAVFFELVDDADLLPVEGRLRRIMMETHPPPRCAVLMSLFLTKNR